jgi:hypothetical protein
VDWANDGSLFWTALLVVGLAWIWLSFLGETLAKWWKQWRQWRGRER